MGRLFWVSTFVEHDVAKLVEIGALPIGSREPTMAELLGELTRQGRLLLARDESETERALDRVRRALELSTAATPADIADETERRVRPAPPVETPTDPGHVEVPDSVDTVDPRTCIDDWDAYVDGIAEGLDGS